MTERILWFLHHVLVHPACGLVYWLVGEARANHFHDMFTHDRLLVEHANHADVESDFRDQLTAVRAKLAKAEDRIKELEKEIVILRQSF